MNSSQSYPGTERHQKLLRAIVSYYETDPRILALGIFGSLGRGNWDQYSDLDLDAVTKDGVIVDIEQELTALCDTLADIGERSSLIVPKHDDEGDVVLASLLEFSIRYHPLDTTSPNIVDSLHVLVGEISLETIKAAGIANGRPRNSESLSYLLDLFLRYGRPRNSESLSYLLDLLALKRKRLHRMRELLMEVFSRTRSLRYAISLDVALKRKRIWEGIHLLHRMRELLMEVFSRTRDGARPVKFFQENADPKLHAQFGTTLPKYELNDVRAAQCRMVDLVADDIDWLSNGQIQLTNCHHELIEYLQRQTSECPGNP